MTSPVSGNLVKVLYGYETSTGAYSGTAAYATISPDINKSFGNGVKITGSAKNNLFRSFTLGSRNVNSLVPLKYEGTVTVEGELAGGHVWFFGSGTIAEGGGGGPQYTHTLTENNTPHSVSIEQWIPTDTASVIRYKGCAIQRFSVSLKTGEPIKFTAEFAYSQEILATSSTNTDDVTATDTLIFAHGNLTMGDALADVTSCDFSIDQSAEINHSLGNRFASSFTGHNRIYDVNLTLRFKASADILAKMWGTTTAPDAAGPDNQATLVLTITNGLSAGSLNQHVITLANLKLDPFSLPSEAGSTVEITTTAIAKSLTSIVVTDGVSALP